MDDSLGGLIARALGTDKAGPGPSIGKINPQFTKPNANEAHWRRKLANQGQISKSKPTLAQKTEDTLGHVLGAALGGERGRRLAKKAMGPINDATPLGNVYGAEEGGKQFYNGLTRGDARAMALGATTFGLSVIPGSVARKGENALMALMRDESGAIRAWHGSPHDFDRFEWSPRTRGTGEGAQAYGDGLYFAENRDVAENYRNELSRQVTVDGSRLAVIPSDSPLAAAQHSVVERVGRGMDPSEAIRAEIEGWRDYANRFRAQAKNDPSIAALADERAAKFDDIVRELEGLNPQSFVRNPGRLYEVNINAEPEDFLDWDAKLSQQQQIAERVSKLDNPLLKAWQENGAFPHVGGQTLYRQMADGLTRGAAEKGAHTVASAQLLDLGIPGIRFLDQGSRGAGNGTRNYVVFDDSIIDILNKY